MKYSQLDRILELEPGKRIVATRTLRADEEHLRDHFPRFPVMPGVMMLESLHQAAMWMVRVGDEFGSSLVLLHQVRAVKFGDFLSPGETLNIVAETVSDDGEKVSVKASATKGDKVTVTARLVLRRADTQDPDPLDSGADVRRLVREKFHALFGDPAQFIRLPSNTSPT